MSARSPRFITLASIGICVLVVGSGLATYAFLAHHGNQTVQKTTKQVATTKPVTPVKKDTPAPTPAKTTPSTPAPVQPKPVPVPAPYVPPAPPAPATVTPAPSSPASGLSSSGGSSSVSYQTSNWAGYVVTGTNLTSVSGSWTVPHPTSTSASGTSSDAAWIGIGGVAHSDLIQVGTINLVASDGTVSTHAFYELLPATAQFIASFIASPGDGISASVTQTAAGVWNITLTNTTTSQTYSTSVNYSSSLTSAEWIQEDPGDANGNLLPLDNFGTIYFTGASATQNGTVLSASAAGSSPITMMDPSTHTPKATPSALSGGSFSVTRS